MADKRRASIWRHFSISNQIHHAKCELCEAHIKRGTQKTTYSTTPLINHLRAKHQQRYTVFENERRVVIDAEEHTEHRTSQLITETSFQRAKLWDVKDNRAKNIHELIAKMIARDCQPISIVEDVGFTSLLRHLEPRYKIPSLKFFTENVITSLHNRLSQRMRNLLDVNGDSYFGFTADIWTSQANNNAFLCLTCHFIDKDYERNELILAKESFSESHNHKNIAEKLNDMISNWNIPMEKCTIFVTDNAQNIKKAVETMELKWGSCVIHTLQLALTDSILSQRAVSEVIKVCSLLVGHFNKSAFACEKLKNYQIQLNLPVKQLMQDVTTRWNSTYYMLSSVLEQKASLALYSSENAVNSLNHEQWALIPKVLSLLAPCEQLTQDMSADTACISMVIPGYSGVRKLILECNDVAGVGTIRENLKVALDTRFKPYIQNEFYCAATLLDPRFKDKFLNSQYLEKAKTIIKEKIALSNRQQNVSDLIKFNDSNIHDEDEHGTIAKRSMTSIWQDDSEESNEDDDTKTQHDPLEIEFETYLRMKRADTKTLKDPIKWWKLNRDFPLLKKAARIFLASPPSSVKSERVFSLHGNVLAGQRNRLRPDMSEKLVLLHNNLRIMEKI